jgi:hypothetical protein
MFFPPMLIRPNDAEIERQSILSNGNKKYVYKVTYEIRKEFTNPRNLANTNKISTSKYPPTTQSELEKSIEKFVDEVRKINGKVFSCKLQPEDPLDKRLFWIIPEAYKFDPPIVSPALEERLYSNEEIAAANVLAQRQQERQEANKVVAKSALAGTGVSKTIKNFLGGRRRQKTQNTRKNTRKQN